MSDTVTVKVPPTFYDDHVSRGCLPGTEIRRTKTGVTVELDRAAFDDLLSDAEYYDELLAEAYDPFMRSICRSAARTNTILSTVGRPS